MPPGGKIRIAEEITIEWLDRPAGATCPNCGFSGQVRQILDIDFRPPDRPHRFVLQLCPACDVRFVDNTHSMDYGHEDVVELGWQAYQVQQGAGIWPIVEPLMRIPRGPGSRVLEIGGGYGFGLDFCARARGWRGQGYDPSLLSAFGRDELGLTVHQGYFGNEHLADGPWDVLIATEVIEHVIIPPEFLRLARAALGENGILILTTPDAAWIVPESSADRLMPLLSPGVHVVLQTQASLTQALGTAGFTHVRVERVGMSLIAYGSAAPFTLQDDAAATRAAYRIYLIERALLSPPAGDLALGFAGRGLFEAANDGDAPAAAAAWDALVPAVHARFGIDLETVERLPAAAAQATLSELLTLIPLNLGMVCFGRAMALLAAGQPRSAVIRLLRVAGDAVAALQAALAKRSITDALYVVLGPLIADEILICAAEAGEASCVAPLAARGDSLAWRGFVGLVNAGAYGAAAALRAAAGLAAPAPDLGPGLRRDAWLSLGHLGLSDGGDVALAIAAAEALGGQGGEMLRQAFIRLVNDGAFASARTLAAAHGLSDPQTADADIARGFAMLALGEGSPADALNWITRLPAPEAGRLRVQVFIRLVNAGDFAAAHDLAAAHDIAALAAADPACEPAVARDAGRALAGLALGAGDPLQGLGVLAGLDVAAAERQAFIVQAFIRLVNLGRFAAAQALDAQHPIAALAAGSPAARDAALAQAMLTLAVGDPAQLLAGLDGLGLPAPQRAVLSAQAFIRLVNAGRYAAAAAVPDSFALAAATAPAAAGDIAIARAVLALNIGDPATVLAQLHDLPPAARPGLAVQAFLRLVNAGRYPPARAALAAHDIAGLAATLDPQAQRDTSLAFITLDLNGGDPAAVAARLVGLAIPPAQAQALLVQAFIRLVNAGRLDAASAMTQAHDVMALAAGTLAAVDAAGASARLALQLGDPAALFARPDYLQLPPAMRQSLTLQSFIRLVNAGRYEAAQAVMDRTETLDDTDPALALDARRAAAILALHISDPATIAGRVSALGLPAEDAGAVLAQAFIRLVNAGRFTEATALAAAHDLSGPALADVNRAHIALALNTGDPAAALHRLRAAAFAPAEVTAFARQIVLRLVNAGAFAQAAETAKAFALGPSDPDLAHALALIALQTGQAARVPAIAAAGGLPAAAAGHLCLAAFTRLVDEGAFDAACLLLAGPVAGLLSADPGAPAQAARLAAVRLELGQGHTEAAMQRLVLLRESGVAASSLGPLAVEGFVRLVNEGRMDAAASLWGQGVEAWLFACPDPLRHDALAARVTVALAAQDDPFMALEHAAAGGLAPDRLERLAFTALVATVNRADYAGARQLFARAEPGLIRATPPLDNATADAMFAAGMLFLQDKRDWRRAAAMLARLRDGLTRRAPAGGPPDALFWPALRAEFIILTQLKRTEEAVSLLKSFIPVYPPCPEDLMAQIVGQLSGQSRGL
jgi:SAM-dependent methyltransferase